VNQTPTRNPEGCQTVPGGLRCAPTPGYFLATLRVAVEFGDAARGPTSILDTLNKYGVGPRCPHRARACVVLCLAA
jgi:hypothetical protein